MRSDLYKSPILLRLSARFPGVKTIILIIAVLIFYPPVSSNLRPSINSSVSLFNAYRSSENFLKFIAQGRTTRAAHGTTTNAGPDPDMVQSPVRTEFDNINFLFFLLSLKYMEVKYKNIVIKLSLDRFKITKYKSKDDIIMIVCKAYNDA